MSIIDRLATAAINRDALNVRSLAYDLLREFPRLADVPPPVADDARLRVIAAGLVELLALHQLQPPPDWCAETGALSEPFYFLQSADSMPRLRARCEAESPAPLSKRRLYAPADFLTFA